MNDVTAQLSLYPLRQDSLEPAIRAVLGALAEEGLELRSSEMSTIAWGEEGALFAGLHKAFRAAAEHGDTVMVVTLSNACPCRDQAPGGVEGST